MSNVSSLFSSRREAHLWTWTLVVVLAIYSTLGLAAKLVGQVNKAVLGVSFFVCLILVGVVILTQGLRVRPGGMEIGVVGGIVVVFVLLGVRMSVPERSHLMEYGILAVFVYEALNERVSNGYRAPLPALCAFAGTSLIGILDECIQAVLPSRVFDWRDILFNVLAALAAMVGMVTLRWSRRWAESWRRDNLDLVATEHSDEREPE